MRGRFIIDNILLTFILLTSFVYLLGAIVSDAGYLFYTYMIALLFVLFFRQEITGYQSISVLIGWIPLVFKNPIVFLNVIGNLCLLIPLGYHLSKSFRIDKAFLYGITFVLLIESLQYFLRRGIFDFGDIVLNSIGLLLGMCLRGEIIWINKIMIRMKQ